MRLTSKLNSAVLVLGLCTPTLADVQKHPSKLTDPITSGTFQLLVEPSGITALDDEVLIVVEDEPSRALRRLEVSSNANAKLNFDEFEQPTSTSFIQRRLLAPLDDLEAIARVSSDEFFVIGSHENAGQGGHRARQKLVLFTRDGIDIVSAAMRQDLFTQLGARYPALLETISENKKKRGSFNIEGMAYDRQRERLLIGLRNPLQNNRSVVISILNAIEYVRGDDPVFADELHLIDLEKNGIRAMVYDDETDALLIVGKREHGGSKRSTLWHVDADGLGSPLRYRSDDKNLFNNVEGLSPIGETIVFVRDNGQRRSSDDNWFALTRNQLGLKTQ